MKSFPTKNRSSGIPTISGNPFLNFSSVYYLFFSGRMELRIYTPLCENLHHARFHDHYFEISIAFLTARMIRSYDPQRQRERCMPSRISASPGESFSDSNEI